jgi:hypothetical protein
MVQVEKQKRFLVGRLSQELFAYGSGRTLFQDAVIERKASASFLMGLARKVDLKIREDILLIVNLGNENFRSLLL